MCGIYKSFYAENMPKQSYQVLKVAESITFARNDIISSINYQEVKLLFNLKICKTLSEKRKFKTQILPLCKRLD